MDTIWARGVPVLCIHPGWPPLMERAAVLSSWRDIMKNPASPNAYSRNDRAFIYGKTAIVVCEEVLDGGVLAATNIFIEELGSWRLIHHQASPIADPDRGSRSPAAPASASLSAQSHAASQAGAQPGLIRRRLPSRASISARSASLSLKSKISKLLFRCFSPLALGMATTFRWSSSQRNVT